MVTPDSMKLSVQQALKHLNESAVDLEKWSAALEAEDEEIGNQ